MRNTTNLSLKRDHFIREIDQLLPDCNIMVSEQQQILRETKQLYHQKETKMEEVQATLEQIHDIMMEMVGEEEYFAIEMNELDKETQEMVNHAIQFLDDMRYQLYYQS